MTEIPVSGGVMLVDDDLAPMFMRHKWQLSIAGYAVRDRHISLRKGRKRERCTIFAHREVLTPLPGLFIDHINRNKLDNRRENLRAVTHSQNVCNTPLSARNTTGLRGAYRHKKHGEYDGLWTSRITVNGKHLYLGCFRTAEDAARAYDAVAIQHFGEFAQPNFKDAA